MYLVNRPLKSTGHPKQQGRKDVIEANIEPFSIFRGGHPFGWVFEGNYRRKFGNLELPCEPGSFSCEDNGVICAPTGDRWLPSPCGSDELCLPAACEDALMNAERSSANLANWSVATTERLFIAVTKPVPASAIHTVVKLRHSMAFAVAENVSRSAKLSKRVISDASTMRWTWTMPTYPGRDELGNIRYCDAANSQFAVVLSNPDPSTTVYGMVMDSPVDVPISEPECGVFPEQSGFVQGFTIAPRGIVILELPARNIEGTMIEERAYRVVANSPLTAYQFNPLENVEVFFKRRIVVIADLNCWHRLLDDDAGANIRRLKGFRDSRRNIRHAG